MSNPQSPQNSATGTYPYYPYYNYYQAVQHAGAVPLSPASGQPWPPPAHGPVLAGNSSKRPGEDQSEPGPSKRLRTNGDDEDQDDEVSDDDEQVASGGATNSPSGGRPSLTNLSKQVATDVWRFVRPLQTRDRPAIVSPDGPSLYTKPDAPFVGCKLCTGWKTWKCIVGMTSTIRNHLRNSHREEYERICREENLKYAGDPPYASTSVPVTQATAHPPPQYAYTPTQPPPPGTYPYPPPMLPPPMDIVPPPPRTPAPKPSPVYGEPPRKGTASDVWRFLRPLETREKPADWTLPAEEPILSRKPEAPFIGCKLCTPQWRVWKCIDGMTSTIRVHLRKEHQETYDRVVQSENLKQLYPAAFRQPYPSPAPAAEKPRWATNTVATDVWYFMRGLENRDQPLSWREPVNEPILDKKPTTPFLGCKLCTQRGQWRTWKCINGMSSTIRKHLQTEHSEIYTSVCRAINLKAPVEEEVPLADAEEHVQESHSSSHTRGEAVIDPALAAAPGYVYPAPPPAVDKGKAPARPVKTREKQDRRVSTEMFWDKLVRYVVASGQPLDLVEVQEFRSLLLFVGKSLADIDLPDRNKLAQLIEAKYQDEQKKLVEDVKGAIGRVSLAVEALTHDTTQRLVITAHYCVNEDEGALTLRSRMIAYRAVPVHYDPALVAKVIYETLAAFSICDKIGAVTFGDALYHSGVRSELDQLLVSAGFQVADYLRNFLPIVNDSMESGLGILMSAPRPISSIAAHQSSELSQALLENRRYLEALGRNPISRAQALVSVIADSPDRLAVLEELRSEESDESLPGALLQEDGRWSAKYLMIERFLAMQAVVNRLLKDEEQTEIAHYALDDAETDVLADIKEFLRCAFAVHEMVGEQKIPLAIMAIPLYEQLLTVLKDFQQSLPEMHAAIAATVSKFEQSLAESRKSEAYSLSIILNPTAKLKWMDDNQLAEERDKAKTLILQKMIEQHQKLKAQSGNDEAGPATQSHPPKETPKGLSALNRLLGSRRSTHKPGRSSYPTDGGSVTEELTDHNDELKPIEAELQRYIEAGVLESGDEYDHFDIFQYWKVRERGYPLLYRVALDVLPVQASVFSTPTAPKVSHHVRADARATNPALDEMIMVLKYAYDPDKLDFTREWIAKESELIVIDDSVV